MNWLDLTPQELRERMMAMGQPAYRGDQVFDWLYKGISHVGEMVNLPQTLRSAIDLRAPKAVKQQSDQQGTQKILWRFHDGALAESVVMKYRHGNSICISTQIGCRQRCAFCASALRGFERNLTAGEMLAQIVYAQKLTGVSLRHVVLMGMGEPLDNLDEVVRFLHLVRLPEGLGISPRHISVSTCGLLPGIRRLAEEAFPITLSISLHAPDDETRNRLMPANRKTGVGPLLEECRKYFDKTGRRISYEYVMIRDTNDSPQQAAALAALLRGHPAHVNLIRLNPVPETGLMPSGEQAVRHFMKVLEGGGISVTLRRRLGGDIEAACGQLRNQKAVGK